MSDRRLLSSSLLKEIILRVVASIFIGIQPKQYVQITQSGPIPLQRPSRTKRTPHLVVLAIGRLLSAVNKI